MTEYRYVIQYPDNSCLYLAVDGPRKEPMTFLQQLREEGFQFAEEQQMGQNVLRILKREMVQATEFGVAVVTDPYSGRKNRMNNADPT